MKRSLVVFLSLFVLSITGCLDILSGPSEAISLAKQDESMLSTEWPTNAERVKFPSSFEWEGDTLIVLSAQYLDPKYKDYVNNQIWVDVRRDDMTVKTFAFWNRSDEKFPILYKKLANAFELKEGEKFEVDFVMTYTFK